MRAFLTPLAVALALAGALFAWVSWTRVEPGREMDAAAFEAIFEASGGEAADDLSIASPDLGAFADAGAIPALGDAGRGDSARIAREDTEARPATTADAASRPRLVLRGLLVDNAELPLSEIRVRAWWRRRRSDGSRPGPMRAFERGTQTGADGRFELSCRAREVVDVELAFDGAGFAPRLERRRHRPVDGVLDLGRIVLERGIVAEGRVIDELRRPVRGAQLRYVPAARDQGRLASSVEHVVSDADGRFVLRDLPRQDFYVQAWLEDFVPAPSALVRAQDRCDVGSLILARGRVLFGRVTNTRRRAVEGCEVQVVFVPGRGEEQARDQPRLPPLLTRPVVRSGASDADGAYRITGLPRRVARFRARHKSYLEMSSSLDEVTEAETRRDVVLHPRPHVRGVVVDAVNLRPIDEYSIRARRIAPAAKAVAARRKKAPATKKKNKKKAKKKRVAKTKATKARASRKRPLSAVAQARARERAARRARERAEIEAKRAAAERVRAQFLVDRFGSSRVRARPAGRMKARPAGRFDIELGHGSYVLDVSAPGYVPLAHGPIVVDATAASAPHEIHVRLERGASIAGSVVDRDGGAPVARARVELLAQAPGRAPPPLDPLVSAMRPASPGILIAGVRSDRRGRFRLPAQRPGSYRLRVRADGYDVAWREGVGVERGRAVEGLRVALVRAPIVFGRVLGIEAGEPWRVLLASTKGFRREVEVEPDGSYRVEGLQSGTYYVRAFSPARAWGAMRLAFEALTKPGKDEPDLVLAGGDERKFEIDVRQGDFAAFAGTVMWNGALAQGLELALQPLREAPLPAHDGHRARTLRDLLRASRRARTGREGEFRFDPLLSRDFVLTAYARVGTARTLIGRQRVRARHGRAVAQRLAFWTASLRVTARDEGGAVCSPRLLIALADESVGKGPKDWRSLASLRRLRIAKDGSGVARSLPLGRYEWLAYGGGMKPARGFVSVGRGETRLRVTVKRR